MLAAVDTLAWDPEDALLAALGHWMPELEQGRSPAAESARDNAHQAIENEEWLRAYPTPAHTAAIDSLCRSMARRFTRAPDFKRDEAYIKLDVLRMRAEPTAAELVRVGIPADEALKRVDKRFHEFQRLFWDG